MYRSLTKALGEHLRGPNKVIAANFDENWMLSRHSKHVLGHVHPCRGQIARSNRGYALWALALYDAISERIVRGILRNKIRLGIMQRPLSNLQNSGDSGWRWSIGDG